MKRNIAVVTGSAYIWRRGIIDSHTVQFLQSVIMVLRFFTGNQQHRGFYRRDQLQIVRFVAALHQILWRGRGFEE